MRFIFTKTSATSIDLDRELMFLFAYYFYQGNAKAKAYTTCIAPQAAYRSWSGAVHVTDRAGVQPIGRSLSLRSQTDLRPTIRTPPWSVV